MSVKATNWAWELGRKEVVKGGELLTLLRVADHADNDGVCWPGEKSVASYTSQDERTVRRHLKTLEKLGLLHRERQVAGQGRGRSHDRIALHLDQPDNLSGEKSGVQPDTDDASTGHLEPVQPDTDDTALYREPTTEPSENHPHSPPEGDAFLQEIFDLWKQATGRNGSTKFSPKRQRSIRSRLKDGHSKDEIRRAVVGCCKSDWHMKRGRFADRDGDKHDELTLILRDTEHVERFARLAGDAQVPGTVPDVVETTAATAAWAQAKDRLRAAVPESTFLLWLDPLEVAGERDGNLVLLETADRGGWTDRRYRGLILEAVQAVTGDYTGVELIDHIGLELEAA